MRREIGNCVRELVDVLAKENRALKTADFIMASSLLERKQACVRELVSGQRNEAADAPNSDSPGCKVEFDQLDKLLTENRLLLERAMRVQGRLIALLGQAARDTGSGAVGYGQTGGYATGMQSLSLTRPTRI